MRKYLEDGTVPDKSFPDSRTDFEIGEGVPYHIEKPDRILRRIVILEDLGDSDCTCQCISNNREEYFEHIRD